MTEVLPEGATEKPRTASLFKSMSLETVTLDDALRLLSLPRSLGTDAADGEEIDGANGRYGPYVKKGTETRSLESEEQLFTITLEEALAAARPAEAAARPRPAETAAAGARRRTRSARSRSCVKEGRFGPYVTDGETNASLRRGDDPETVTIERAVELLADRRAKGPAPKQKRGGGKRCSVVRTNLQTFRANRRLCSRKGRDQTR